MSETESRIARFILNSVKSGKVDIRINREEPIRLEASDECLKVTIPERLFSGVSFKLIRHRLTDFRAMREAAEILKNTERRLDIYLDGEKVFSIGKGVSSLLGNEKLYLTNLIRSFKP